MATANTGSATATTAPVATPTPRLQLAQAERTSPSPSNSCCPKASQQRNSVVETTAESTDAIMDEADADDGADDQRPHSNSNRRRQHRGNHPRTRTTELRVDPPDR